MSEVTFTSPFQAVRRDQHPPRVRLSLANSGRAVTGEGYRPRSAPLTCSKTRSGGGKPFAAFSAACFS